MIIDIGNRVWKCQRIIIGKLINACLLEGRVKIDKDKLWERFFSLFNEKDLKCMMHELIDKGLDNQHIVKGFHDELKG
jgi:hypothetical protein